MQSSAKSSSTLNMARPELVQNQWDEFVAQLLSGILIDGKYRIKRQISSGGMGAVFEAVNESSGGRVVIKVPYFDLTPDLPNGEANPVNERIKQEVQAAIRAGAQHPGIVRMMDCVQLSGDTPAIVMEFLEGDLLSERIKSCGGSMEVSTVLRLGRQMASALAAVHAAGVIHRDLKPSNVMIVRDPDVTGGERAKVFDFGIAKVSTHANRDRRLTQVGWFMGTRFYSAPEQQSDSASVDDKADVYSLGIVFYEMLGGSLPLAHPLTTKRPAPPVLMQLIARMTTASATLRPAMAQVAAILEQLDRPERSRLRPEVGWSLFAALVLALGVTGVLSAFLTKRNPDLLSGRDHAQNHGELLPSVLLPDLRDDLTDLGEDLATSSSPNSMSPPDLGTSLQPDLEKSYQIPGLGSDHPKPQTEEPHSGGTPHTTPCPTVSARCLSIVSAYRSDRFNALIRQALTQDVRLRLCPDEKLTLSRTSAGVLEVDASREISARNRTIINLSLQTLIHSDEYPIPQKVVAKCKQR